MVMRRQKGVALAIVVWFVAAMSLLVTGIVFQARVDTRLAQMHVARAKAAAIGDGAIQLMLASLETGQIEAFKGRGVPSAEFVVGESQVTVYLIPVTGLIDLNSASGKLLKLLFKIRGEMSEADADLLANNVVNWRKAASRNRLTVSRFTSVEDLLRVEGITRDVMDKIRGAIATGDKKQSGVDWQSAPQSVLKVLASNDLEAIASIAESRSAQDFSSAPGPMPSGLDASFQRAGAGNRYRLDAVVHQQGQDWLRRRWVVMEKSEAAGNLPWQFIRTEAVRAVGGG